MSQLWNIEIARPARKELSRLPSEVQSRIAKAILALENDPFPHGCKKLRNRDGWRTFAGPSSFAWPTADRSVDRDGAGIMAAFRVVRVFRG
jgi:mRNA interferase RelE/StbE